MPKINIYLPGDLAEAVRDSGVPVSAICQSALEQAVRRVTAIRSVALGDLGAEDLAARLPNFTERARTALRLAVREARDQGVPEVGTEHLLSGILAEGGNLALQVLDALEIPPDQVTRELARVAATRSTPAAPGAPGGPDEDAGRRFSGPAAGALELTTTEAIGMRHNYIGCEHLLVGLALEPDGTAGTALRALGADARAVRRAVRAAVAGYAHLRAQGHGQAPAGGAVLAAVREELKPLIRRIERLEARAAPAGPLDGGGARGTD
jgi:ATP-dependent Clp protease ATP-binding subunit ClpA